ncbi:PX domain-containing protein ypt35 [Friedmanniomyces endolithicus]|nr:PX domain-containing protein ypt35 [Friedmanniomyces endolithicus]
MEEHPPPPSHVEERRSSSPARPDASGDELSTPAPACTHADPNAAAEHMQGQLKPEPPGTTGQQTDDTLLLNSHNPPSSSQVTADPPPFWSTRHARTISTVSYHSLLIPHRPNPILLEDRSEDSHAASHGCWAQSVILDAHTIVSGPTGIGAYVVWHCTVRTLHGGDLELRKRYSEFDQLRVDLVRSFPHAEAMIPKLPRKSVVSRFRPKFLESRKAGLQQFLSYILLNPEFAASPMVKEKASLYWTKVNLYAGKPPHIRRSLSSKQPWSGPNQPAQRRQELTRP